MVNKHQKTLTFGSLHADLQGGHSSFGGIHCERLRDAGSDVVSQAWTLALHLGAVHGVADRHREGTTCTEETSGESESNII